jgi:hypothetical protein
MTPHVEKHLTAGDVVRDIVVRMSNGRVKPVRKSKKQTQILFGEYAEELPHHD